MSEYMVDRQLREETGLCSSRGPRIGAEGSPRCRLPIGHDGAHRPDDSDGWGHTMTWTDPPVATPGPAEPPSDVREQIAQALWSATEGGHVAWSESNDWWRAKKLREADAVLALPAVRNALAAQETLRRVEALADELDAEAEARGLRLDRAVPPGAHIRRALVGDS